MLIGQIGAAVRRARVPENRELRLLAALGEDLPGAMVVEMEGDDEGGVVEPGPGGEPRSDAAPEGPLKFP